MKCVYAQVNLIEQPAHHLLQDDSPRDNERRIRAQWIQDIPNDRWKQNWNQPKKWTVEQLKNVKYELIKAVSQTFQSLKRPKDHSWQERQWKKRAEVQTQQAHNRRNSPKSFLSPPRLQFQVQAEKFLRYKKHQTPTNQLSNIAPVISPNLAERQKRRGKLSIQEKRTPHSPAQENVTSRKKFSRSTPVNSPPCFFFSSLFLSAPLGHRKQSLE